MKFKEAKHMLKSYAGMTHKLSDNQGRPKLDQAIDLVLKELEIYIKIAEKLAEGSIEIAKLSVKKENYNPPTKQELIDWARKEVEKDG